MQIKLISPKMSLRPMDSEFKRVMSPSLALLTLASLTPPEYEISIDDENIKHLNLNDNPDLVGITVNVDTSRRAYEIAGYYRTKGVKVILGGIHVSANPEEALNYADAVCIGDAEEIWKTILHDLRQGQLQVRYSNTTYTDLKYSPGPRWDLIDRSKYLYTNIICSSRGCPFKCEFCYNSCEYKQHQYQNRPMDDVINDINALETRHVMFIDDNFIGNIQWTKQFLKKIIPLRLKWNAAVSANIGEYPELLDLMKESGCKSLFIGLESINQQSVSSVNKFQNNTTSYEKLISEIHTRGIMVNGSLAFGFDYDYPDVFKNTLDWLVKNKVETMTAHILTPYPGTKLHKRFQEAGRIIDFDWTRYNTSNVVFLPKNITQDELFNGYLWIYKEFYSWKNIMKRLPDNREQMIPYLLFNFGYRKFGRLTSKIAQMGLMNQVGNLARKLSYGLDKKTHF